MEAPRLRLIILGCLRGLVKPGYTFGITSFIREQMLLGAMQREIDGQTFTNRGLVEAAIANLVSPAKRPEAYNKAVSFLMQGNLLSKGGSYSGLKKLQLSTQDMTDIRKAAALFKVLKKTQFYDIMATTLKSA